jgi:hypothetical protein
MSLTLEKMRFSLLEAINQYSDDSTISYRLLDQYIEEYRVKWFELEYNKFNKVVPNVYYQTLSCLEVETVDIAECCSTIVGCDILRTREEIPGIISLTDGELIAKVSAVGIYNIPFQLIKYENLEYFGEGRYEKNRIGAFYYNNRIYLWCKEKFNYSLIEKISMRAVFRYPSEAGRFSDCTNKPCWAPDTAYPMDERLWNYAKNDILANEFKIKLASPEINSTSNAKTGVPINPNENTQ